MLVLLTEYDCVSEVSEAKDEAANQKLLCYYVMNNDVVHEQQVVFERPDARIMYHLKPLFIRAKVDGVEVNKVKIIEKFDTDIRPYNMVLSNYKRKISHILGVI